jgi:hypothetical protein
VAIGIVIIGMLIIGIVIGVPAAVFPLLAAMATCICCNKAICCCNICICICIEAAEGPAAGTPAAAGAAAGVGATFIVGIAPPICIIMGCIPFCPGIIIIIGIDIGIAAGVPIAPVPGAAAVPVGRGDAPMFIDALKAKLARTCLMTSSISMLLGKDACGFVIPGINGAPKVAAQLKRSLILIK